MQPNRKKKEAKNTVQPALRKCKAMIHSILLLITSATILIDVVPTFSLRIDVANAGQTRKATPKG